MLTILTHVDIHSFIIVANVTAITNFYSWFLFHLFTFKNIFEVKAKPIFVIYMSTLLIHACSHIPKRIV